MKHADFIHLLRLSEHASEENSVSYRRGVARFAALGYAWVVGCLLLALGILAWAGWSLKHGQTKVGAAWAMVTAAGLLWTSLRALWLRLEPPTGQTLLPGDAPQLFAALEKIRVQIKGPPIHHVMLTDEFNASISQHPRYGLFGGATHYLTIGMPLMLALDRSRFLAVLAHEYAHLRGDHGVLGAWVYRTRQSWLKLYHELRHDGGVVSWLTQGFLHWYFPRFAARSFALARHDEYEADRLAGKLVGAPVMAAALTEIQIKSAWLNQIFWPAHWHQAIDRPQPLGPMVGLARLLPLAPEEAFAQRALREAVKRLSDIDDTHPVLRDRLEALDQPVKLPAWSDQPAVALLGVKAKTWLARFDQQWCKANASDWRRHHAYLGRLRDRAQILLGSIGRNNATEMVELADLQLRLDPKATVRPHYERALSITPEHGAALRGLVHCLPATDYELRLRYLDSLFDASADQRWWACSTAVEQLEQRLRTQPEVEATLKLWRDRLHQADEAEHRAWMEHSTTPFFNAIRREDLNDFEKGEFLSQMAQTKAVARAWLVGKNLREFAQRRCYTLFVELPNLDDESRYELCRHLEHSLHLPGRVLVLYLDQNPSLRELQQHGLHATYQRALK